MKEISSHIVDSNLVDYSELLGFLSHITPADLSNRSDFLDFFHLLNFSDEFDGSVLLISGTPVASLYFSNSDYSKIKFLATDPAVDSEQSIGLLLHYHVSRFKLNTYDLSFELWSHQNEMIKFLQSRK